MKSFLLVNKKGELLGIIRAIKKTIFLICQIWEMRDATREVVEML